MDILKIYFAAPVFTQAERIWNRMIKKEIEEIAEKKGLKIEIVFPQDIASKVLNNKKLTYDQKLDIIYNQLFPSAIPRAKIMLAILDGADVDSGAANEMGGAKMINKKIIGIRTDFRGTGEEKGLNLMLFRGCDEFIYFPSFNESHIELAEKIMDSIIKVGKTMGSVE